MISNLTPLPRSPTFLPLLLGMALLAGIVALSLSVEEEQVIGAFETSLRGRTDGQRHNAELACRSLNGRTMARGATFSFNRLVGPWSRDRGYRKAPVSYGGEMVITWGGGVCQVSTTLYNAALLAGLEVNERDHHMWPTLYVPPGRDAAVAYGTADLKLKSPHARSVRIEATVVGDRLICRIRSRSLPRYRARINQEIREVIPPTEVVVSDTRGYVPSRQVVVTGRAGYRVRTYRSLMEGDRLVRRELLSEDYYRPLNRVIKRGL